MMHSVREGQLIEDSAGEAWLDVAVSHALLRQVAARERPATVRAYVPRPTVAFGRLDALRDGFQTAIEASAAGGFEPVLRNAGGHAAAYTENALVYEEITPHDGVAIDLRAHFEPFSDRIAAALRTLGIDARVGAIPGEYCPGDFSVNAAGTTKLAGVAQRVVRGAALVTAVIVASDGPRLRAVLADVYRALDLEFDENTVGTLADVRPGTGAGAAASALLRGRQLGRATLDAGTLAIARELAPRHRLA